MADVDKKDTWLSFRISKQDSERLNALCEHTRTTLGLPELTKSQIIRMVFQEGIKAHGDKVTGRAR